MNLFKKCIAFGIFFLLLLGGSLSLTGTCPVENLDTSECYDTIQDAIDDASTSDTIRVHTGTYTEHVLIDKSITLEGDSKWNTYIKYGTSPAAEVIKITADNVTVRDLFVEWTGSFSAYYAGIKVESDNNTIDNVIIGPCPRGIYLYASEYNTVSNCLVAIPYNLNHEGITIGGGGNNTVCNNIIASTGGVGGYGIVLAATYQNTIVGNHIANNNYGIYLFSATGNYIYYNNFTSNNTHAFTFLTSPTYNQWDDGSSEGNYWEGHNCENPYTIATGEVDNYPLCSQCSKDCSDI
jgi:parallel beta-helix repeat protein